MPHSKITFKGVADQYLTWLKNVRNQSLNQDTKEILESEILSRWQPMPIADITRTLCIQLLESVLAQTPNQAVKVASAISNIFVLALGEGHVKANPMRGLIKLAYDDPMPPPTTSLDRPIFGL